MRHSSYHCQQLLHLVSAKDLGLGVAVPNLMGEIVRVAVRVRKAALTNCYDQCECECVRLYYSEIMLRYL